MPKIMQRWVFKVVNIQFSPSRRHNAPSLFYTRASSSSHLLFQDGANKAFESPVSVWHGDIVHSTRSQCGVLRFHCTFEGCRSTLGEEVSNNIQPRASYKKDSHVPKKYMYRHDADGCNILNISKCKRSCNLDKVAINAPRVIKADSLVAKLQNTDGTNSSFPWSE